MRRAGAAARLEVKLNRFQLLTILVLGALVTTAAGYLIVSFGAIPLDPRCTSVYEYPAGLVCSEADISSWVSVTRLAETLPPIAAFLPWLMGILVGVPAVGSEIETRTAMLAWTVGPSRSRWLTRRVVVIGPILLLAVLVPAIALTILAGAQKPLIDPLATFDRYQSGAIVSIGRAVLAFGIGLLVGTILGRVLPSLIVSAGLCFVGVVLLNLLFPYLMPASEIPDATGPAGVPIGLDTRYRLANGELVDWAGALRTAPDEPDTPAYDAWESSLVIVAVGYPASSAVEVSTREGVIASTAGLICIAGVYLTTRRRRPY